MKKKKKKKKKEKDDTYTMINALPIVDIPGRAIMPAVMLLYPLGALDVFGPSLGALGLTELVGSLLDGAEFDLVIVVSVRFLGHDNRMGEESGCPRSFSPPLFFLFLFFRFRSKIYTHRPPGSIDR